MSATAATFDFMNEYLDRIAAFLLEKSRLSFTGHKRAILRGRLETRIEQLKLADFSAYWEFLLGDSAEESALYDLVTTNETSFFRNPAQFEYLKERIFPELENRAILENRNIRVLSAGCSTGEEPYSLAMTFMDAPLDTDRRRLEIVAGDISETCLQIARKGRYEAGRLKNLPPGYRSRFMKDHADGSEVRNDLKRMIRFVRLNLDDLMKSDCPSWHQGLGVFDIIFCRNVMIYFASPCQQQLVNTLDRMLLRGGYLFTGDAEPLHLFRHELLPVAAAGCLIYQKTERRINDRSF